jgi:Domain of unknown function (DUF4410)
MISKLHKIAMGLAGTVVVGAVLGASCEQLEAQNSVEKFMVGSTKVTVLHSYTGMDKLAKPVQVIVYEVDVPANVVTIDHSMAGRLMGPGLIGEMKGEAHDASPEETAAHVQAEFTKVLMAELKKMPIPATSATYKAGEPIPEGALLVRGEFTSVNLGNKSKRMMIGLGRGASDVKAHVVVSLMTKKGPVVMGDYILNSESGKKPGAAAGMGVGSAGMAAADVAMSSAEDHGATVESDTARMAKTMAKQMENMMTAQQWIAPKSAPANAPANAMQAQAMPVSGVKGE